MVKRLGTLNSRRGVLILWAPPSDMCHLARVNTETELGIVGRSYSKKCFIWSLYATGNSSQLCSNEQKQFRDLCRFNFESGQGFDLVIIAGSEAPMIMELLVWDASWFGIPTWNFAYPESILDKFWNKLHEEGIMVS